MNTRTLLPINLQVGQLVQRSDGLSGQVVSTDGYLFEVLWSNATKYHYRANGSWCGSWGVDQCSLNIRTVRDSGYVASDKEPAADKLDTFANYALGFGWGLVAGVILQRLWPL